MADKQLVDYIGKELKSGVSIESIRASLLSIGWSPYDVDEAIRATGKARQMPKPSPLSPRAPSSALSPSSYGKIGFFDSVKKGFQIFFLNKEALEEVATSNTTKNAILLLLIIGFIFALFSFIFMLFFVGAYTSMFGQIAGQEFASIMTGFLVGMSVVFLFLFPLMLLAVAFLNAGIFHLFAKLFGGQAKFIEFFRAVGHFHVAFWLLWLLMIIPMSIPFLGIILQFLAFVWMIVVYVFILKQVHKLSTFGALLAFFVPIIIFLVVWIVLFVSMMASIGIMNPQNLMPNRCEMESGLNCRDYVISSGTNSIDLALENGMGTDIFITSMNANAKSVTLNCGADFSSESSAGKPGRHIKNGESSEMTLACKEKIPSVLAGARQERFDLTLVYYNAEVSALINHTMYGLLFADMQS